MVASRGANDTTLINGLPLADVNATLWQLGLSVAGVSLGALLIAGATGALIVGRTLAAAAAGGGHRQPGG